MHLNRMIFYSSILMLSGCLSSEDRQIKMEDKIQAIYSSYSKDLIKFFANEAAAAHVSNIRTMKSDEHPKIIHPKQTGCGFALFGDKLILIDATREHCISFANLGHEISHIAVLKYNCRGHGDTFYKYYEEMAKRFIKVFPNKEDRGGWKYPVESVLRGAVEYRPGEEKC